MQPRESEIIKACQEHGLFCTPPVLETNISSVHVLLSSTVVEDTLQVWL